MEILDRPSLVHTSDLYKLGYGRTTLLYILTLHTLLYFTIKARIATGEIPRVPDPTIAACAVDDAG